MPYQARFADTLYSPEWLRRVYIDEDRNASQVAELIGCTPGAVLDALRKHQIPVKSMSEVVKKLPHLGSGASRPKRGFLATLHNGEWVLARKHLNASELAREAGCSVSAAQAAMRRFGVQPPCIRQAKQGRFTDRLDENLTVVAARKRARVRTAAGACVLCGKPGIQVNHKDRNPRNNAPENLERVCQKCHSHQHGAELWVMIDWLKARGVSYREIHEEARRRILEGAPTLSPYE